MARAFTLGFVFQSETIFAAGLSGLAANKASIDLANEPTQHSLLLDVYLLKWGEEKSGSFSTFPLRLSIVFQGLRASSGIPGTGRDS